jgi:hypothetical protein
MPHRILSSLSPTTASGQSSTALQQSRMENTASNTSETGELSTQVGKGFARLTGVVSGR